MHEAEVLVWVLAADDAEGSARIVCRQPDGSEKQVSIADLDLVLVATNDRGPWGADVWWLLFTDPRSPLAFPNGASGENEVLAELQKLPGFDNQAVIAAMASTEEAHFVCWKSPRLQFDEKDADDRKHEKDEH